LLFHDRHAVPEVCGLRGGLLARRRRPVSFSVDSGIITYIHKESWEEGGRMLFDKMIIR
jgi:hypothetical protein